jgi:hypothetical protein
MHAARFALFVTCVLHQISVSTPNVGSEPQADLQRSEPRLDVLNYSGCFAEFRIRSSGRDRQWRKLRLNDGERDSITISAEGSYDVQIWFYIDRNRWIVNCQNRIPLGSWTAPDGSAGLRHEVVTQWLATPVDGEDGITHEYKVFGETTVPLVIGENITWPIVMAVVDPGAVPLHDESRIFRLLGR